MSNTNAYFAVNRRAFERIADLTWNQFLERYGWHKDRTEWDDVGGYLSYCLGLDSENPTRAEIAPILGWTIRKTQSQKTAGYFDLTYLNAQLKRDQFIRVDVNAEGLESESDTLILNAVTGFLGGVVDDRTLWSVLTLHDQWASEVLRRIGLNKSERTLISAVRKRFGRCRPIFDWQTLRSVSGGYRVLREEESELFGRFVRLVWKANPAVNSDDHQPLHFRDLELARKLNAASLNLRGNCLIHYAGP